MGLKGKEIAIPPKDYTWGFTAYDKADVDAAVKELKDKRKEVSFCPECNIFHLNKVARCKCGTLTTFGYIWHECSIDEVFG